MRKITTAREQFELLQPWLRTAAEDDFAQDFGDLPDGTQSAPNAMQANPMQQGQAGGVDLNNDGVLSLQEQQASAEEAKWNAQESMYDLQSEQVRAQAPPTPSPSAPTTPAAPVGGQAGGGQVGGGSSGGSVGGQAGGGGVGGGGGVTASADPPPAKGAPSLWLASQMMEMPPDDVEPIVDSTPAIVSGTPGIGGVVS